MHYRNLSAHFIQPIGKRKLSAGKVPVTVCLLLKNVLDKGYTLLLSPSQIIEIFLLLTHQLPATNIAYHVLHGGATAFHPYFKAFLPHADASFPLSFLCKTGKLQSLPLLCSSHIHQFLFLKLLMSCVAFLCGKFTAKVSLLLPRFCSRTCIA